jgi:hypothetical protein
MRWKPLEHLKAPSYTKSVSWHQDDLDYRHAVKYVAVGIPVTGYPRTDPGVRDLRTGLLPRVSGGEPLHRPWMKNPNPW